jgi:hypothetical protein
MLVLAEIMPPFMKVTRMTEMNVAHIVQVCVYTHLAVCFFLFLIQIINMFKFFYFWDNVLRFMLN